MEDIQFKPGNFSQLNLYSTDDEVKTMWGPHDSKAFDFLYSDSSSSALGSALTPSQDLHNIYDASEKDFVLSANTVPQTSHDDILHTVTAPLSSSTSTDVSTDYTADSTTKGRKFSSLTQKRKRIVDKYIHEVLTKSHEYDYGEFGSQLWSALLLEYFRLENDHPVQMECIVHWTKQTAWGRKMKKAYDTGIQSIKDGTDPLREFELAKVDIFRKRSPPTSPPSSQVFKYKGRRRKIQPPPRDPDPIAVHGFLNDHDYCKNPWLEAFGDPNELQSQFSVEDFMEFMTVEKVHDMGGIGGEIEI